MHKSLFVSKAKETKPASPLGKKSTFLNPFSYLIFTKHWKYYECFDNIYIDGIVLAKLASILLKKKFNRISFDMTSLAPIVFGYASQHNLSVALVGGEPGIADKTAEIFREKFPGIRFILTRNGFFDTTDSKREFIANILDANPDVLVVSMGTPQQEKLIHELCQAGWDGTAYTSGGFFHQTASHGVNYYPSIINRLNLRFLYRMYDEPKLLKRYLFIYPIAILKFISDFIRAPK